MADFKDDYYAEVDNAFADLRGHPFNEQDLLQPTPQERGIPFGPAGWVENADGDDGEAKVIINADGLTILEGKLNIQDAGGNSVLSAAGFDGSWTDFVETGVYNGRFIYGTQELLTNTEVDGGEGDGYASSLSDDIPYWVVKDVNGGVEALRITDAAAQGGHALYITGDDDGLLSIYQDVPIPQGQKWDVIFNWRYNATASNEFTQSIHTYWMDENHETISDAAGSGLAVTTDQNTYITERVESIDGPPPTNARYLRLFLQFSFNMADTAAEQAKVFLNGVRLSPRVNYGKQEFPDGVASIDADDVTTDTITGTITVEIIDANQNNWNPTGLADVTTIVVSGLTAARTITGLAAQSTGRVMYILNQSGQSLVLAHESGSSTAANRFACPNAANLTIRTAGGVALVYAANRWRVVSP